VGSVEYLNYQYLLTVADIRATNPGLWSSWKNSLLKELYMKTHSALLKGLQYPVIMTNRLLEHKKEARNELVKLGISESVIDASWLYADDDYFLRYSADEIAWHTIAIASSREHSLPLVLLRPQSQRGSVEIFVYTINEGPIFSISTGTLDQLGLTILDARIMTTLDNYVLNSFQVLEQSGIPITELSREINICKTLRYNLLHKEVRGGENIHRESRQAKHFPIPTHIKFSVDPLGRHTIIELVTTDRAGLLSQIGSAFLQQKIHLHSAKITTIGRRVEDIFYVPDQRLQPLSNPGSQQKIREEILETLNN
jgi:[protein-PII] uridylyltransferase